ncbi:MAG: hypothetical protein IPM36_09450 [Lewinellaceae bacterium]|nr:hypothetical protein [Lewinellaceae bacterium]
MPDQTKSNYIKTLEYLLQYRGDGRFYKIDEALPDVEKIQRRIIANDLIKEGYADTKPGTGQLSPFKRQWRNLDDIADVRRPRQNRVFVEHELKITLKGIEYLRKDQGEHKDSNEFKNINDSIIFINSPNAMVENRQVKQK